VSARRVLLALLVAGSSAALAPAGTRAAQGGPAQASANGTLVATHVSTGAFVSTGALPVPPQPSPPPDFAPAPVPNQNVERPRDQAAERPRTEIAPNLFTQKEERRGEGFVAGSVGRYDQNRQRVTPGVNLTVPLQ
jgi:hypothetical protein